MSNESSSPFVFVFWSLVVLVLFLLVTCFFYMFDASGAPNRVLVLLVPTLLLLIAYLTLVPTLVYRDASRRGLNPWLWATVATFVPNLIGVIIYLVMRTQVSRACVSCGKGIKSDFKVCPYCGQTQESLCPRCEATVAHDWKVCPHCGQPLTAKEQGTV
jgi:RNA polymerase subunit RPABC4/transcription elongation factor Spt4